MASMIIANRLNDGLVVFFVAAGEWTHDIEAGTLIGSPDQGEALLRVAKTDEADCLVVDPNVIEVEVTNGRRKPTAIREAIRAFGPSPIARTDQLGAD